MFYRSQRLFRLFCLAAIMLFIAGPAAIAQTAGKIPREVIDQVTARGTALVLVGLNVPWQMESRLSQDGVKAQRQAIASVQSDLLNELAGRTYRVIRRYEQVPGIALEVGADALAEMARSATVVNVLLDRPVASGRSMSSEKVPWKLFEQVATHGTVLVLAGLRTPWQREDQLSEELLALQRKAILDAQRYILAELSGTEYKVMRLYRSIPGIALRVGLDALTVLERSPAVTNVLPDRPAKRSP